MAAPNNPISGLLGPLSDYADQQTKMNQAGKMLMGKYMLDQNTAASSRRFDTLNANISGYEARRKDLETHKWNMLKSLIDPQGNAFQGQQRSAILKQLGFSENTYQVMLGGLNTDLKALDRVLQSNYQLRNETYGFGRAQGVYNTYAGGGGAGGGAPTGEEAFLKHLQQGGAPAPVTKAADTEDQVGEGWVADAGNIVVDVGKAMGELGKGYAIWVQDPNNFVNKAFKEGLINPNSDKNYALAVYRKALSLLPDGVSEDQIQEFWLAPGLQGRLKEIIEAGRNDKKSFDSWLSERLSPFDKYFKKLGGFSDDIGLTGALNEANLWIGDQVDKVFPHSPDSEIGGQGAATPAIVPAAAASPAETPSTIVPPTPFSPASPDLQRYPMESTPTPTLTGDVSGVPSPDAFGTGQAPSPPSGVTTTTTPPEIPNRMEVWQEYVTSIGLPWDPRAVPPGGTPWSSMATEIYKKNLQNLFYEGSQMGTSPSLPITQEPTPMASDEWHIDSEISVVPTYEVFQQRLQSQPQAPFPNQQAITQPPTGAQQIAPQAQGAGQALGMMDEFQGAPPMGYTPTGDPMGGGVGQPTMNQQVAPMASTGGTEGVMDVVDDRMNPYITPGEPQGVVAPPQSVGFGDADMDTWYQPAMDIGGPSGDPFTRDDALVKGDVGGPGTLTPTPSELAAAAASFTGETWNDFIAWGRDKADPITIAAIVSAGGASYFISKTIRKSAFDAYDAGVKAYNKSRSKGTKAKTTIVQDSNDVKELEHSEKRRKKEGRKFDKQKDLDKARDRLGDKKSLAWKDYIKKQAKRASWIGLGGAIIYGLATEAIGMDNVDRQIGLVLDGNPKAQFALDAILKVNPITPVVEMHQQPQGITTLRKERHTGPEMMYSPGMLGAGGGRREGYPLHLFPKQGLNSGSPQVQAMMSELEKKNQ